MALAIVVTLEKMDPSEVVIQILYFSCWREDLKYLYRGTEQFRLRRLWKIIEGMVCF